MQPRLLVARCFRIRSKQIETEVTVKEQLGRGGGKVVNVLSLYSDDPSLNPVEVYKIVSEKNKKRPFCKKQSKF